MPYTPRLLYPGSPTRSYWRGRHTVYRCYDADGALVYIGVSSDISERLYQHRLATQWWSEVDRVSVKVFPNRRAAFAAEVQAIRSEQPRRNIRHNLRLVAA